jgi:hypothetical protein
MPDHWAFVAAAYAIAAVALGAYWRRLVRRERELATARPAPRARTAARQAIGREPASAVPRTPPAP